jgi:hypothetical protein
MRSDSGVCDISTCWCLQVNNGVLEVHIPKTGQPERNQRTIDVQ